MLITRRLEFDAGHRIPNHTSQCRHLHVKTIAHAVLIEHWDHAFLVYRGDQAVTRFLASLPDHKTVVLPVVPTAENLATEAFRILDAAYVDTYGNQLRLQRVRLYETPNNWADAMRPL
ncbi:6-carboxytetrahydropterin synthase [Thiobacillus sp.]|uniref:6-pyruvoyl trahydropterin synthase family protein n=1 Tax=Thiobacillus sp. TaxID=924 RepID=UPI001DF5ABB8|nr:6-carboxytetrahydropterin synthase [Thiobacillus sp.]MBC2760380.1 6-carboxytetrahydropterin synthase [Thiobacillus sp.]